MSGGEKGEVGEIMGWDVGKMRIGGRGIKRNERRGSMRNEGRGKRK